MNDREQTTQDMNNLIRKGLALSLAAVAFCACAEKAPKVPAIDLTNLDTTVAPGEDFYAYATRGWQQKNPLKPEYSRYGSFDVLAENNVSSLYGRRPSMVISNAPTPGNAMHSASRSSDMSVTTRTRAPHISSAFLSECRLPTL